MMCPICGSELLAETAVVCAGCGAEKVSGTSWRRASVVRQNRTRWAIAQGVILAWVLAAVLTGTLWSVLLIVAAVVSKA